MGSDDRTRLANLLREREQLIKSKMPADEKARLQRPLDLMLADAAVLIKMRDALAKDIDDYKAKAKALTASLKALNAKFNATAEHRTQVLKAIGAARSAKTVDPSVARLNRAFQDLNMNLLDFSPFQEIDGA